MNRQDFDELASEDHPQRGGAGGASGRHSHDGSHHHHKGVSADSPGLKTRLFRIFYWVQKERNTTKTEATILIGILFAQIYALLISPVMKLPFKGALYAEIGAIFDVVRIYPAAIRNGGEVTYWFFMCFPMALIAIYVFLILILDSSLTKTKGKYTRLYTTLRLLQLFHMLFFWVLLIPTIDFFISIFECNPTTGMHKLIPSLQCWSPFHSFYCAIFSVGLFLFFTLSILISLLSHESRSSHTNALTRLETNQEVYLTVYRVVLVVASHYTADQGTYQWLTLTLHALISLHLYKNYQVNINYYDRTVSTTYGAGCLGYVWLVGNSIIIKAFEGVLAYQGQVIIIIVGLIGMQPVARYIRSRRVREIMMNKQQDKLKDDLELDQFITNFQAMVCDQESDEEARMMFLGFLYTHKEECSQLSCPIRNNANLYHPLTDQLSKRDLFASTDTILHQHFLNSIYLDYQRNHPNTLSAQHHTQYAQFLFYQMGNVHMALIELNLAQKISQQAGGESGGRTSGTSASSLQQAFSIFKYKQLIEEYLQKKFKESKASTNSHAKQTRVELDNQANDGQAGQGLEDHQRKDELIKQEGYAALDFSIVITFENLYYRFERAIEQSATDHIEFWSHLDSNMIDLNIINKLGLTIINRSKQASELWGLLAKINPKYPNALYLYGNYLAQIKNDLDQGEDYKQQCQQVKQLRAMDDYEANKFEEMFADDTAVVIMNGSREQQGKIMKTNLGISKLFGYSQFEVQGHDVNILMPPMIAQKHQFFLDSYFKHGKERILNSCFESFAMYRTGVIFPVNLVIKSVPSLRNDIQYIGMVKRSERDYEYIITDENGRIDSISDGVISLLKLPISFFKEHEIPIQILVPELCQVCRPRNQLTGLYETSTYFDVWNGQRDLKFIVPKNFSNAGGRSGHHFGHGLQSANNHHSFNNGHQDSKNNYETLGDEYENNDGRHKQQSAFIGMRSPESLKSVCSMFKNAEHKSQPERYKTNLLNHVNYSNPDFEKLLKVDIQTRSYGGGVTFQQGSGSSTAIDELKIRVFKIYFNKKGAGRGKGDGKNQDKKKGAAGGAVMATKIEEDTATETSSVNNNEAEGYKFNKEEDTLMDQNGMTAMQTLNDNDCFQRYLELIAKASLNGETNNKPVDFERDLKALKGNLERQKKIRTQGKIMTNEEVNRLELDRMIYNLREIEKKIIMKAGITIHDPVKDIGGYRISNPIAAAFAHRLAIFVKTSQPMQNLKHDSERSGSAKGQPADQKERKKISIVDVEGELSPQEEIKEKSNNLGFGAAVAQYDSDSKMNSARGAGKAMKQKGSKRFDDPGNGEWTNRVKRIGEERKGFGNDFFAKNPMSQTAGPMINHNELIMNLKNKFNVTYSPQPKVGMIGNQQFLQPLDAKDPTTVGAVQTADTLHLESADQKSVKFAMDDSGSVASDTKNLQSSLRVLRNALYENYAPQSIQNLRYSAQFVAVILIAMTIASFLVSQSKYDQLKENFKSVQHSQERMLSVTGINNAARFCELIKDGRVNNTRYGKGSDFFKKMKNDLNTKAINLQKAQNNLSQTKYDFTSQNVHKINPTNITLYYNTYAEVGLSQKMNVWAAVMQLSVNSFKLKDLPLQQFKQQDNLSLWFVLKNSLNNLLEAVSDSTEGILSDTLSLSESNKYILMILLLVASGGLIVSMCVIMPVVTKVHQDKDKLLSLFLLIEPDDVKEQLKRCREFFTTFHAQDELQDKQGQNMGNNPNGQGGNGGNKSDEEFDEDDDKKDFDQHHQKEPLSGRTPREEGTEKEQQQKEYKNKFQRKNKKLKKYSTNYLMLLFKFSFVIAFLESYFLYQYFSSDSFLVRSLSMIKEAASITNRSFSNFLLYQVMIEIIATNGTALVYNKPSQVYIVDYLDSFNQELETFLKVHSDNVNNHDQNYNTFFDNLIYKSVCQSIKDQLSQTSNQGIDESSECASYLGGILEKGLYSANLAYWDDIREIRDGFFKSDRSQSYLRDLLNSPKLISVERLNEIYFSKAYKVLVDEQNMSINVQFQNRNKEIIALFSVYIALLVFMYLFVWNRFVESMRLSLWVTKSMLAIIPMEVIEKIKVIKDFLFATSQASVRAMKD